MKPTKAILPRPPVMSRARWPETEFDPAYQSFLDAHANYWGSEECVVLAKFAVNAMRTVAHWRRGPCAVDVIMPAGTPLATFMDRNGHPSDQWDGGQGLGISGNFTTHSGVLAGYVLDSAETVVGLKLWEIYPGAGRVRRQIYPVDDTLFGTANARAYHAILDRDHAPLGGADNPYFALWSEAGSAVVPANTAAAITVIGPEDPRRSTERNAASRFSKDSNVKPSAKEARD